MLHCAVETNIVSYKNDSNFACHSVLGTVTMTSLNYRPDIDGLRAIAVLAVVLHHLSAPLMPVGYVGNAVFFVISDHLITRINSREMEQGHFQICPLLRAA